MKLTQLSIPDVVLIEPVVYADDRGWFMESFNEPRFHAELGKLGLPVPRPFVQGNHSVSKKGVLRGLHFQHGPHAQGKLVRVTQGAAFDVAVDIRPGSPTEGQWVGVELNARNNHMLWIPEGFAHGFVALEDNTHFLYQTTDVYHKESEGSICWDDPDLKIEWPVREGLIISEKDSQAQSYAQLMKTLAKPQLALHSQLIQFAIKGDERGSLVALQGHDNVPFGIQRVYYLTGTKHDVARGFHAHRQLNQLAVCVSGRCTMLMDDGVTRVEHVLENYNEGIYIPPMVWHEMTDFSDDCVLMVLADAHYDEQDYIRDYEQFLAMVRHV